MAEPNEADVKPAAPAPAPAALPADGSPALQRYKARLGFWQAICGTIISGGVAVAIPASVDAYKASLDLKKAKLDLALKQKEIDEKRVDQYQDYVSKFLTTALNQDIELRLRFSEYFSYVADDDAVGKWKKFHDDLQRRRSDVRQRIEDNEMLAGKLRAVANPDAAQQIEIARIVRDLSWDYAELGYARQDTNITAPASSLNATVSKGDVVADSATRFAAATIDTSRSDQIARTVDAILANKGRYDRVAGATGVPWYVIGILHREETGGDFTLHMNGDPLSERTVHAPQGLPKSAAPPFTWEDSTIDFMHQSSLADSPSDYDTTGGILYRVEKFNGMGYRQRGASSPYVWGCTDQYVSGSYANFGSALSEVRQRFCGFAAILKAMQQRQIVTLHSFQ